MPQTGSQIWFEINFQLLRIWSLWKHRALSLSSRIHLNFFFLLNRCCGISLFVLLRYVLCACPLYPSSILTVHAVKILICYHQIAEYSWYISVRFQAGRNCLWAPSVCCVNFVCYSKLWPEKSENREMLTRTLGCVEMTLKSGDINWRNSHSETSGGNATMTTLRTQPIGNSLSFVTQTTVGRTGKCHLRHSACLKPSKCTILNV